jgi:hypothetical protein
MAFNHAPKRLQRVGHHLSGFKFLMDRNTPDRTISDGRIAPVAGSSESRFTD